MKFNSISAYSFPKAMKLKQEEKINPGPGKYSPIYLTHNKEPEWKIGTEKRIDMAKKQNSPGPGAYDIPKTSIGPKYSMSSRAGLKIISENMKFPGPASYKPVYKNKSGFFSFGIRSKMLKRDKTPGPGYYNIRKDKDFISPSYLFGKEKRLKEIYKYKKIIPGPGKYELDKEHVLNSNPKYSFSMTKRGKNFTKSISPGPGAYNYKEYIGKDAVKKSFGTKIDYSLIESKSTPGPGHYQELNTNIYLPKSPSYKMGTSKRENEKKDKSASTPGPGQYNFDRTIKYVKLNNPSWKIGTAKRKCLDLSGKTTPGVGNYTIYGELGTNSPKYSMGTRNSPLNNTCGPGPGAYKSDDDHILYNHNPTWKIGTSKREDGCIKLAIKEGFPGPGKYGYSTSESFFTQKIKFGSDKRFSRNLNNNTPGPGSYHIPCSIQDVTNYNRKGGNFDEKFKFI